MPYLLLPSIPSCSYSHSPSLTLALLNAFDAALKPSATTREVQSIYRGLEQARKSLLALVQSAGGSLSNCLVVDLGLEDAMRRAASSPALDTRAIFRGVGGVVSLAHEDEDVPSIEAMVLVAAACRNWCGEDLHVKGDDGGVEITDDDEVKGGDDDSNDDSSTSSAEKLINRSPGGGNKGGNCGVGKDSSSCSAGSRRAESTVEIGNPRVDGWVLPLPGEVPPNIVQSPLGAQRFVFFIGHDRVRSACFAASAEHALSCLKSPNSDAEWSYGESFVANDSIIGGTSKEVSTLRSPASPVEVLERSCEAMRDGRDKSWVPFSQ